MQVDSGTLVGSEDAIKLIETLEPIARKRGLTRVRVGEIEFDLGPAEPVPSEDEDKTQRRLTANELERRMRDERRRIASAASGGPIKRLVSASE